MLRSSLPWYLCLFLLGFVLVGCPPADDDDIADDDDAADDDDDDDDDVDECLDPTDVTDNIGGESVVGSTVSSDHGFSGSCSNGAIADDLLVFTAPATATYLVSTDHEVTGFDTLLFAFTDCYADVDSELACNDDISEDNTNSEIAFEASEGQEVFVAVEGYESTGGYELTISPVVCGDGIVVSVESCDDGNTESGDGCDAECQWECDGEDQLEDDDGLDQATPLEVSGSITDLFLCTTDLSKEFEGFYVDVFSMDVAEGEYIHAELLPGGDASDCSATTASVTVVDADGNAVVDQVEVAEGDDAACPAVVGEPAAGTYYVIVFGSDPQAAPQSYGLSVVTNISVCGDGTHEGLEECDDGNLIGGDGCSALCGVEDTACTVDSDISANLDTGAAILGDSSATADERTPDCTAPGSNDVTYSFTAASTGPVIVSTDHAGTGYDTALHVRDECLDPGTQIACNDDKDYDGGNYNAELFFDAVAGESYSIIVDGYDGESGAFELVLSAPTCGDGTIELGEDCDDGNTEGGDGCEADCTPTPVCAVAAADQELGLLAPASSTEITLAVDDVADFGGLSCSGVPSGNAAVSFSLDAAATVEITYSFEAPTDVQVQLFADDKGCMGMTECSDPYPKLGTTLSASLSAGDYLVAVETWEPGTEGDVQLTIDIP